MITAVVLLMDHNAFRLQRSDFYGRVKSEKKPGSTGQFLQSKTTTARIENKKLHEALSSIGDYPTWIQKLLTRTTVLTYHVCNNKREKG